MTGNIAATPRHPINNHHATQWGRGCLQTPPPPRRLRLAVRAAMASQGAGRFLDQPQQLPPAQEATRLPRPCRTSTRRRTHPTRRPRAAGGVGQEGGHVHGAPPAWVVEARAEALTNFYIFKAIAEAGGCGDLFVGPEATFTVLQQLTEEAVRPDSMRLRPRRPGRRSSGQSAVASPDEAAVWCSARTAPAPEPDPAAAVRVRLTIRTVHVLFEEPEVPLEVPSAARGGSRPAHRPRVSRSRRRRDPHRESATPAALAPDGLWLDMHPPTTPPPGACPPATTSTCPLARARRLPGARPCPPSGQLGVFPLPIADKRSTS